MLRGLLSNCPDIHSKNLPIIVRDAGAITRCADARERPHHVRLAVVRHLGAAIFVGERKWPTPFTFPVFACPSTVSVHDFGGTLSFVTMCRYRCP